MLKVGILAGGHGTRLAEETEIRPKPMVEIGGKPILWHIMMIYAHFGFKNFVIALGYKGEHIKKYIVDYCTLGGNLTVDLKNSEINPHNSDNPTANWPHSRLFARQPAMATWNWMAMRLSNFPKSLRRGKVGSTAPSLYSSQRCSTTLKVTKPSGKKNP
jgi:glucose-1-phosphate cytidylyltransferase